MRVVGAICALLISTTAVAQTSPLQIFLSVPWSLGINLIQAMNRDSEKVYYIQVSAEGTDLEQARQSAFRMAVERTVGTVIASETEVRNARLQRDEIISYASGYVTDYKLVEQSNFQGRVRVKMEVWVKHSAIANRLLSRAESTQKIDGLKLTDQVASLNYERDQAQRILSVVMADYPHRAFIIENQTIATKYFNRGPEIIVEFDIRFNRSYLYALWETLKNTSQSATPGNCYPNCQTPYVVYIQGRNDGILFTKWTWSMGFTESSPINTMFDAMISSRPGVLLSMKNSSGNAVYQECFFWVELDGQVRHTYPTHPMVQAREDHISIDGNAVHRARVELRNLPNISTAQNIQLEVVRGSRCPR